MCYIIYNKLNKKLNDNELIEAYIANPHGIGISYCLCGQIQQPLKYFNGSYPDKQWFINDVLPKIIELNSNGNVTNLAIHFRLSSAGNISLDNVHPFKVSSNIHLMMNGTSLDPSFNSSSTKSDTNLISLWLSKSNPKSLLDIKSNKEVYDKLKTIIGNSNVLLLSDDDYLMINNKPDNIVWNKDKSIYRSSTLKDIANKSSKID